MRLTNSNKKMWKTHCAFKPGKKETIIILWIQVTGFFSFLVCCAEWLSVTAMCDIATNLRLKRGDLFYPNAKKLQKTISYFFVEKIFRTKNVPLFQLVMEAKLGETFHLVSVDMFIWQNKSLKVLVKLDKWIIFEVWFA